MKSDNVGLMTSADSMDRELGAVRKTVKVLPAAVRIEAQRALDWRKEYNRGGTPVGWARARDIANGTNLSYDTISRMVSFFARHQVDKQGQGYKPGTEGYPSAGRIAWALWGGDPGRTWAIENMRAHNKRQAQ